MRIWSRKAPTALVGAFFVFLLCVNASGLAGAAEGGDYSLRPVRAHPRDLRDQSYVVRSVTPGQTLTDRLEALNLTDQDVDVDITSVDAAINNEGAFSPLLAANDVGRWIKPEFSHLRLTAKSRHQFDITITVPPDAAVGDHIAAVVIQKTGAPAGAGVHVVQRVGVRAYLTVEPSLGAAPATRSFTVESLRWIGRPADRVFEVDVRNTGSLLIEPLGKFVLSHGDLTASKDLPVLGTIPPGERRTLRFSTGGPLDPGTYHGAIVIHPVQGGPDQTAEVTFAVASGPSSSVAAPKRQPKSGGSRSTVIAAAVAAVLALGVITAGLAVRARRPRQEDHRSDRS